MANQPPSKTTPAQQGPAESRVAASSGTGSSTSDLGTPDAQTATIPGSAGIPTTADAINPASGEKFGGSFAGHKGRYGFPEDTGPTGTIPRYDPKRLPVEVTSHVMPEAKDELWAAVRVAAPNLTPEFAEAFGLDDEILGAIARREIPPPPSNGPIHTSDLYLTPGGWQSVPAGVDPSAIGQNKITR